MTQPGGRAAPTFLPCAASAVGRPVSLAGVRKRRCQIPHGTLASAAGGACTARTTTMGALQNVSSFRANFWIVLAFFDAMEFLPRPRDRPRRENHHSRHPVRARGHVSAEHNDPHLARRPGDRLRKDTSGLPVRRRNAGLRTRTGAPAPLCRKSSGSTGECGIRVQPRTDCAAADRLRRACPRRESRHVLFRQRYASSEDRNCCCREARSRALTTQPGSGCA
jgi:hypothetical protein